MCVFNVEKIKFGIVNRLLVNVNNNSKKLMKIAKKNVNQVILGINKQKFVPAIKTVKINADLIKFIIKSVMLVNANKNIIIIN